MSTDGELSPGAAPAASEVTSAAAEREAARRARRRAKAVRVEGWAEASGQGASPDWATNASRSP